VQILVTHGCESVDFYSELLKGEGAPDEGCPAPVQAEKDFAVGFQLRSGQNLGLGSFGSADPNRLVNEFALVTDDAAGLMKYLQAQGVEAKFTSEDGSTIAVEDPEGHKLRFVERKEKVKAKSQALVSGGQGRIMHVGFIVANREKMDRFYRDVLGFRLYWQGGMKDDRVDWVSMQIPDGTDWIEYMLNIPADADKHLLGVMNHIALGVPSVRAAAEELKKNGVKLTEEPKIGRDGKWQLNLYDPDGTRVEFMEFTPVEKPCCSEFMGEHPRP
jgi:catechol 2,3-dioxygenase-like lactoylglutathione lyase family enzyme